jgi:hypothetical protein
MARRESSRAPVASFKPRINIRSFDSAEDLLKYGPLHVLRAGVMPDGHEVFLGRTVDTSLTEARYLYWAYLFDGYDGNRRFLPWVPEWLRWAVMKWYPVEVKGYEMTPLPPLQDLKK